MRNILEVIERGSEAIDGRDFARLAAFIPAEFISTLGLGFSTPEAEAAHKPIEWTEENVKNQIKDDLEFAFAKALNKRGISASCMHSVICMWVFALGLDDVIDITDNNYTQYGLPLLKDVAIHFNLPNPIGDDVGDENKYAG